MNFRVVSVLGGSLTLCVFALGCASETLVYRPKAQNLETPEMSEEEAHSRIKEGAAHSYEVAVAHRYKAPGVVFRPDQIEFAFAPEKKPNLPFQCTIRFDKETAFNVVDRGNNPRLANSTKLRFVVSLDEVTPLCQMGWSTAKEAIAITDALIALQKTSLRNQAVADPRAAQDFETTVRNYRSLKIKPTLSEDAHRQKVLAENAVQERRYYDAIDHYDQALKIAPWWPEGRYQHAMLLGQQGVLGLAITELKNYLALSPESAQARSAQDQIYVWEDRLARMSAKEKAAADSAAAAKASAANAPTTSR